MWGASLGVQGTSRAQDNLRVILSSPGVEAIVLPANEFLLSFAPKAFDEQGDLVDAKTICFLEECFNNFVQMLNTINGNAQTKVEWSATYDTVILGFGVAGATAARFAADAGAQVLLVDAAPYGHEGGNTRYAGQVVGTGDDFAELKKYYQQLTYPMDLPEDMVDTYVDGMCNMRDYYRKYLDIEPFSFKKSFEKSSTLIKVADVCFEYPEYEGVYSYDLTLVHQTVFDAALWKILQQKVADRADKIDVWLESRAIHLIQDPVTKVVTGAQISRGGQVYNGRAKNGVVLANGGFENNKEMVQNYLGADHLAVLGSLYNTGDGVNMGLKVGAKLWHMENYEALGLQHGLCFAKEEGKRGRTILNWFETSSGSLLTVGDDGTRCFREDETNRHGHIYQNGQWRMPIRCVHPYLIFDQTKLDEIMQKPLPVEDFKERLISAPTIAGLAQKIDVDAAKLEQTVADFNHFAQVGRDYAFNRAPETMRAFDDGPYYAMKMSNTVLNTQGGPKRNTKAEVLDTNEQPIPHLYSAGELGGISANQYQGGNNLAECLIFGKIAGQQATATKDDSDQSLTSTYLNGINDLLDAQKVADITCGPNQYLGSSQSGIGGQVMTRVTFANDKIEEVEVVMHHESEDVGLQAIREIPEKIVAQNNVDVDVITGASATSRAIKEAVADALEKVK